MKKLRDSWNWSTSLAVLVFGIALTMVVTSCGQAKSPVSPTTGGGSSAIIEPSPTPTPTPTATPTPTPTPTPPTATTCSPGYWKNHPEVWAGYCGGYPYAPATCEHIQSDLEAKGGADAGQPLRERAANYLNGLGIGICPGDTF